MAQSISQEAIGATGLPGATAASRHAGATASGAPTTGTFAVGDYVVDQTGKFWVCTTAGTPGTWGSVGGATALTYYAGSLSSNVLPAQNTLTTIFTTSSLATGYYLLNYSVSAGKSTSTSISGSINAAAGTASVTFLGQQSASFNSQTIGTQVVYQYNLSTIVQVTSAGTLLLQVTMSGSTQTVYALDQNPGTYSVTGYNLVKIA